MCFQENNQVSVEQIKNFFYKMLKSQEEKLVNFNKEMYNKQEENLIKLISGNTTLANHRLVASNKKVTELKESLQFTQNNIKNKIRDFKGRLNATDRD